MYKLCKTEQSAKRQREFELALLRLMSRKNYFKITIADLCREMNAPRKAFYRYFDAIDDVLDALLDYEYIESMRFLNNHSERNAEKQNCEYFFTYWSKRKELLDLLEEYGLSPRLISRAGQMMLQMESVKHISLKEMKKISFSNAAVTMMVLWHHSGMKQSPREMGAVVQDTFEVL